MIQQDILLHVNLKIFFKSDMKCRLVQNNVKKVIYVGK